MRLLLLTFCVAASASLALAAPPKEGERTLQLEELWRRGGGDDEVLFGVISQVVEDKDGTLYVLDSQLHEIFVFDSDGEHLRTMGRRGEGPGEFQNPGDLFLGPSDLLGVVQIFPGKIVQLTREGDPAANYSIPTMVDGFQVVSAARGLSDRIVMTGSDSGRDTDLNYLRAVAPDGKVLAEYHQEDVAMQFGGMQFQEKTHRNFAARWTAAPDGRVASALEFDPYRVHVWKPSGELDFVAERPDYELVSKTDEEKKLIHRLYKGFTSWNPNSEYHVAATHMTVGQLNFQADGELWVLPADGMWRCKPGIMASFDVFDRSGSYVRRVHLQGPGSAVQDGIFFSRDRIYVVTNQLDAAMSAYAASDDATEPTEDAEPMQLVAYRVRSH